ncbi:MAG: ChrR family anti-sigma-E factor, partial [Pseudomonadota bacterium]
MTDNIKHQVSDELLMAYSAGNLPEAFSLTIATHISLCDESRARLGAFDSVGGNLIEAGETAELSEDSFEATMAMIENTENPIIADISGENEGVLPQPLRDYVGGDVDSVKWRSLGMGVKQAILPTSKEATARLLFIPAGTAMPDHGHVGTEMTLVLQGAFSDEVDRFARGDIEIADEHM